MRWWDGTQWTGDVSPGGGGQSTDGFAIASLVLGIIGGSVLAIIFGFVARGRIKRSGGAKSGKGMATAGIVLGCVWLALIAAFAVAAVTGALDSENADDYSGTEREIAVVVDRFEELADDERTDEACSALLTPDFASAVAEGSGKSCGDALLDGVEGKIQAEIDIESIQITGDSATLRIDEGGDDQTWTMIRRGGAWRIDAIE